MDNCASKKVTMRKKKIIYACGCSKTIHLWNYHHGVLTTCKEHGEEIVNVVETIEYLEEKSDG